MASLVQNLVDAAAQFATVATVDPVSAVLLAVGALITGFSALYFGYLSARGVLKALMDLSPSG